MTNKHGEFIWYELMTPDPDAAQAFYGKVVGWTFTDFGEGMDYRVINAPEAQVGGIMPLPDTSCNKAWYGYIGVDDVDATADAITAKGGSILKRPEDIPGIGRFAFCADPQGVQFYIMRGASDGTSEAFASDRPRIGHAAWNELVTTAQPQAMDFYTTVFGWTKDGEMDMGEMGTYEFLRHGSVIGAIMTKPPQAPGAAWNIYFRVEDIDAAADAAKANGGQVMMGPHEVPGGDHIIVGSDPQGAVFCLVGKKS